MSTQKLLNTFEDIKTFMDSLVAGNYLLKAETNYHAGQGRNKLLTAAELSKLVALPVITQAQVNDFTAAYDRGDWNLAIVSDLDTNDPLKLASASTVFDLKQILDGINAELAANVAKKDEDNNFTVGQTIQGDLNTSGVVTSGDSHGFTMGGIALNTRRIWYGVNHNEFVFMGDNNVLTSLLAHRLTLFPVTSSAAEPTMAFGDSDTGFYESADNVLSVSTAGVSRLSISTTDIISDLPLTINDTITSNSPGGFSVGDAPDNARIVHSGDRFAFLNPDNGWAKLIGLELHLTSGTNDSAHPTLAFGNDGTGLYESADNVLNISTGTVSRLSISTTDIISDLPLTATSFIKTGGTSSQFLKADGSVDENVYALDAEFSDYAKLDGTNMPFTGDIAVDGRINLAQGSGITGDARGMVLHSTIPQETRLWLRTSNGSGDAAISVYQGHTIRLIFNNYETGISAQKDGAASLYYNNSLKFSTNASGAEVLGNAHYLISKNDSDNVVSQLGADGSGDGYFLLRDFAGNNKVLITGDSSVNYITSGDLGIGTNTPQTKLHVEGSGTSQDGLRFQALVFDTSPQAEGTGGGISFGGNYTDTNTPANVLAGIKAYKENGTSGSLDSALTFFTRKSGASPSISEKMRISSDGHVSISSGALTISNTFDARLFLKDGNGTHFELASGHVGNGIFSLREVDSGEIMFRVDGDGQLVLPESGTAAKPTLSLGASNSGFYLGAQGELGIAIDGAAKFYIDGDGFTSDAGAAGAFISQLEASSLHPVFSFAEDQDTGIGRLSSDRLSLIAGGNEVARLTGANPADRIMQVYGSLRVGLSNNTAITDNGSNVFWDGNIGTTYIRNNADGQGIRLQNQEGASKVTRLETITGGGKLHGDWDILGKMELDGQATFNTQLNFHDSGSISKMILYWDDASDQLRLYGKSDGVNNVDGNIHIYDAGVGSFSRTYINAQEGKINNELIITTGNIGTYTSAEADTLDSVTGRGNTTLNPITVGSLTVGADINISGEVNLPGVNNGIFVDVNDDVIIQNKGSYSFKASGTTTFLRNPNIVNTVRLDGTEIINSSKELINMTAAFLGDINGDHTEVQASGVYFDRAASYLRPKVNNAHQLYIGAFDGSATWNAVNVHTNAFNFNGQPVATTAQLPTDFVSKSAGGVFDANVSINATGFQVSSHPWFGQFFDHNPGTNLVQSIQKSQSVRSYAVAYAGNDDQTSIDGAGVKNGISFGSYDVGQWVNLGNFRNVAGGGVRYYASNNGAYTDHTWYGGGTEIMRLYTGGGLNINHSLDVGGNVRIDGATTFNGGVIFDSPVNFQHMIGYPSDVLTGINPLNGLLITVGAGDGLSINTQTNTEGSLAVDSTVARKDIDNFFATTQTVAGINLESTVPSLKFNETDQTGRWRLRGSGGSLIVQYAADGSNFSSRARFEPASNSFEGNSTFNGAVTVHTGSSNQLVIKDTSAGTIANPAIAFKDSADVRLGEIGYLSTGDSKFTIANPSNMVQVLGSAFEFNGQVVATLDQLPDDFVSKSTGGTFNGVITVNASSSNQLVIKDTSAGTIANPAIAFKDSADVRLGEIGYLSTGDSKFTIANPSNMVQVLGSAFEFNGNAIYHAGNLPAYVPAAGGTFSGGIVVQGVLQVDHSIISVGANGLGSSIVRFFDDSADTYRGLRWDDTSSEFKVEDSSGQLNTLIHAGNIGNFTTSEVDTLQTVTQRGASTTYKVTAPQFEATNYSTTTNDSIAFKFSEGRGWGYNAADNAVFYNASGGNTPMVLSEVQANFQVPVKIEGKTEVNGRLKVHSSGNNVLAADFSPFDTRTGMQPVFLYRNSVQGTANYMLANGGNTYFGVYNAGVPNDTSNMVAIQPSASGAPELRVGDAGSTGAELYINGDLAATQAWVNDAGFTTLAAITKAYIDGLNVDADTLDTLTSTDFIRSNQSTDVTGHTEWQDGYDVRLGTGADLRLLHDSGTSYIRNYTGNLYLRNYSAGGDIMLQVANTSGDNRAGLAVIGDTNTSVRLFYNGSNRLETTNAGISVSGVVTANGGNSGNWNTAYGWGNHATAGYLTSENDTLQSVTNRGATTTNKIIVGSTATNETLRVTSNNPYVSFYTNGSTRQAYIQKNHNSDFGIVAEAGDLSLVSSNGNIRLTAANVTIGGNDVATEAWVNAQQFGDITGVTAGTNLNGGGTSGDVTLNLNSALTGISSIALDGILIDESDERSGLLEVHRDGTNAWAGYAIDFDGQHWTFMGNGTNMGLYDDSASDWILYATAGGGVNLRYSGNNKLSTTSAGGTLFDTWNVNGALTVAGNTVATQAWVNAQSHLTNPGTVTQVSVGTGLDISNAATTPSITLDFSEIAQAGTLLGTDDFVVVDGSSTRVKQANNIGLSIFNNDTKFIGSQSSIASSALDTTTANGIRQVTYSGYSKHLLSWNSGGSTGSVQQEFDYNTPVRGWRIRNKTDNNTWSGWGYVAMTTANQGHISGSLLHSNNLTTYITASYINGLGINATTLDNLDLHTGRNNEANKVVRTDANGYIQAGWINTTSGDNGTLTIDRVYASSDGYLRYYSLNNFRQQLLENNEWLYSKEGKGRIYFATDSHTYLKTHNNFYIRNASNADILTVTGVGHTTINGYIRSTYNGTYSPRYDTAFHVLQSQHWYSHSPSDVMYLGESGNTVRVRGVLSVPRGDQETVFQSANTAPNPDVAQFQVRHDFANVVVENLRGNLTLGANIGVMLNYSTATRLVTTTSGVTVTGAVTASNFVDTSDSRLKEELNLPLPGLSLINKLEPKLYLKNDIVESGFYADQLPEEAAYMRHKIEDDYWGMDYKNLHAVQVNAIKELNQKVLSLEAENSDLENRVIELETRMEMLIQKLS